MGNPLSRRTFGGILLGSAITTAATAQDAKPQDIKPQDEQRDYPAPTFKPQFKKPQLGRTISQDFVLFGHYDLDLVKRLLEKEPALLNTAVDWGAGDWETALGGAAHMGRRDIAEYLISKGARMDLFAAAMLGNIEVVKSMLAAHPGLIDSKGPHGIPLIVHAKQGKKEAEAVLAYLESFKKPE